MSMGVSKTSYSMLQGGAKGYINIGGWNTTLTDVSYTAKETIGVTRQEGANKYMYVQLGTATAGSAGAFLSLATAISDTNGVLAPLALTANGVASTGLIAKGMTITDINNSGPLYTWALVEGFATGYMMTDSGLAQAAYACPSTSTANLLDGGPTALSAVARNLGVTVATATAQPGSAGVLVYWKFKSPGNFGNF